MPKRTYVYVDGFNLYYGCIKGTDYKWLDLSQLCDHLLTDNDVERIRYFTARVSSRPDDPRKAQRQQAYFRALRTLDEVQIVLGTFLTHDVHLKHANSSWTNPNWVEVTKTEEKGSDVNLATHLLHDAHRDRYECAVIISNDSDLVEPVKIVREHLGKTVGILNPQDEPSQELQQFAHFTKRIRDGVLGASQFPDELEDDRGKITKPNDW